MDTGLLQYGVYFFLTLGFSTLFAMGGVGSAIGLVPIFAMMGIPLNLAKALGLFINSASTITASLMNFFRGVLDIKFALPLIVSVMVTTPIGAWMSQYIQKEIVEWILEVRGQVMLMLSFLLLIILCTVA